MKENGLMGKKMFILSKKKFLIFRVIESTGKILLGDQIGQIKLISYDMDLGKFQVDCVIPSEMTHLTRISSLYSCPVGRFVFYKGTDENFNDSGIKIFEILEDVHEDEVTYSGVPLEEFDIDEKFSLEFLGYKGEDNKVLLICGFSFLRKRVITLSFDTIEKKIEVLENLSENVQAEGVFKLVKESNRVVGVGIGEVLLEIEYNDF